MIWQAVLLNLGIDLIFFLPALFFCSSAISSSERKKEIQLGLANIFLTSRWDLVLYYLIFSGYGAVTFERPNWTDVVVGLLVVFVIHEVFFYFVHRLFHQSPRLYRLHSTHHEFVKTEALTNWAFHPLEYLALSSVFAVILILPVSIWILPIWKFIYLLGTILGHVEKEKYPSWLLKLCPFKTNSMFHKIHHEKPAKNYGLYFRFLDEALATVESKVD